MRSSNWPKLLAAYDGIYTSHMRHEDTRSTRRWTRCSGSRARPTFAPKFRTSSSSGPSAWGQADRVLAYIEKARAEGLDITQDQYAYTASSTGLSQLIPDYALEGGRREFRQRLADPAQKAKIVAEMKQSLQPQGTRRLRLRRHRLLQTRPVAQRAEHRGGGQSQARL